jgi:hypothetical protein
MHLCVVSLPVDPFDLGIFCLDTIALHHVFLARKHGSGEAMCFSQENVGLGKQKHGPRNVGLDPRPTDSQTC